MKISIKNRVAAFLLLYSALVCVPLVAAGGERQECIRCGMYLDLYALTRHILFFDDGRKVQTCSLACAAEIFRDEKKRITKVLVADFQTGDLIDADDAIYLEGSDIPGVMSFTSRIAFGDKARASAFQKEHGGALISFSEALAHQMED